MSGATRHSQDTFLSQSQSGQIIEDLFNAGFFPSSGPNWNDVQTVRGGLEFWSSCIISPDSPSGVKQSNGNPGIAATNDAKSIASFVDGESGPISSSYNILTTSADFLTLVTTVTSTSTSQSDKVSAATSYQNVRLEWFIFGRTVPLTASCCTGFERLPVHLSWCLL